MIREENIYDQIKNYFVDTTPSDFFNLTMCSSKLIEAGSKNKADVVFIMYMVYKCSAYTTYSWLMQRLQ